MNFQRSMLLGRNLRFKTQITVLGAHNLTCPEYLKQTGKVGRIDNLLKRAERSGKVRLGFIPEEFFTFFYPRTGVTGSYLFGIMVINYLVSKEIYVMEHEYYTGLSVFVILYLGTKKFGTSVGEALDSEVQKVEESLKSIKKEEELHYETIIKNAEFAQWRAQGQSLLMEAKKERVAMQLEANYRERLKHVSNTVKKLLDYHVKLTRTQNKIHQKWMCVWIVDNVLKSITPEMDNKIIDEAIDEMAELAADAADPKSKSVGFG